MERPPLTPGNSLAGRLAERSATWLDPAAPGPASLASVLDTAVRCHPADRQAPAADSPGPLLFPLLYAGRPRITPLVFHQLIDAAAEARRTGRTLQLLTVPTGRSDPCPGAGRIAGQIAETFTGGGHLVNAAGDATGQASAASLAARAATAAYSRRAVDLPDLLTAAAADTLGTSHVFLTAGLRTGRNLTRLNLTAPLARLHHPSDPWAPPPPGAKQPPAGTDSLHATAFTLELTHSAAPGPGPASYLDELHARLRPLWNQLRRQDLTGHQAESSPAPLRITSTRHARGTPVAVPLFGAPAISAATTTLVTAAALAGPPVLAVDDLTPRWCYTNYPAGQARDAYRQLAARHDATIVFLTDLPGLDTRLNTDLNQLTVDDLRAATGPRSNRARGALTGWDAIHLAVMHVACTITGAPTIAAQAANLRQTAIIAPDTPVISITGTLHAGRAQATATVPASWLTTPKEPLRDRHLRPRPNRASRNAPAHRASRRACQHRRP